MSHGILKIQVNTDDTIQTHAQKRTQQRKL